MTRHPASHRPGPNWAPPRQARQRCRASPSRGWYTTRRGAPLPRGPSSIGAMLPRPPRAGRRKGPAWCGRRPPSGRRLWPEGAIVLLVATFPPSHRRAHMRWYAPTLAGLGRGVVHDRRSLPVRHERRGGPPGDVHQRVRLSDGPSASPVPTVPRVQPRGPFGPSGGTKWNIRRHSGQPVPAPGPAKAAILGAGSAGVHHGGKSGGNAWLLRDDKAHDLSPPQERHRVRVGPGRARRWAFRMPLDDPAEHGKAPSSSAGLWGGQWVIGPTLGPVRVPAGVSVVAPAPLRAPAGSHGGNGRS